MPSNLKQLSFIFSSIFDWKNTHCMNSQATIASRHKRRGVRTQGTYKENAIEKTYLLLILRVAPPHP